MFGLIRILLLLVIIAAVALLIRPDLIEMAGLPGPKPPQSNENETTASTPVAEQQAPESATTTDMDSAETVEQTAEETAVSESAAPEEEAATQESDTTAESGVTQEDAPAHDPETLKQSGAEWGFDSSPEATPVSESVQPEETAAPQESGSDTAAEADTLQKSTTAHDPEMLKQSDAEWGFDSSPEATPDTDNAAPEASDTPQESDSGTTDSTPDEAALRQEVEELLELAADIIDNPDQK